MSYSKVMSVEGPNGAIKGDLDDDKIGIIAFSHALKSSQGKREHGPIVVVKSIDKSTVQLFQALVQNQTLKKIHLSFLKDGSEFFTIDLENAQVISLHHMKETLHGESNLKMGEYEE